MTHHPGTAGRTGPSTAKLSPRTRGWVNVVGLSVWVSGVCWLLLHYFGMHAGPFGPERSPAEVWWLKAHGAFAFLSLWTGGLLWGQHIVKAWRKHQRRWTGSVMLGTMLVLILTGYLLYYAGEGPHDIVSIIHWALGLALPLAYLSHRLIQPAVQATQATPRPAGHHAIERHRARAFGLRRAFSMMKTRGPHREGHIEGR
jgi:hypothetical protein